jgi:hypothetical protein
VRYFQPTLDVGLQPMLERLQLPGQRLLDRCYPLGERKDLRADLEVTFKKIRDLLFERSILSDKASARNASSDREPALERPGPKAHRLWPKTEEPPKLVLGESQAASKQLPATLDPGEEVG